MKSIMNLGGRARGYGIDGIHMRYSALFPLAQLRIQSYNYNYISRYNISVNIRINNAYAKKLAIGGAYKFACKRSHGHYGQHGKHGKHGRNMERHG